MTARTVETAGEGGGDGDGLRGSPMNAPTQGVLGSIMAWQRPGTPSTEQKECLPIPPSAIESSERPMAVVGRRPSGKSRVKVFDPSLLHYRELDMATFSETYGGTSLLLSTQAIELPQDRTRIILACIGIGLLTTAVIWLCRAKTRGHATTAVRLGACEQQTERDT